MRLLTWFPSNGAGALPTNIEPSPSTSPIDSPPRRSIIRRVSNLSIASFSSASSVSSEDTEMSDWNYDSENSAAVARMKAFNFNTKQVAKFNGQRDVDMNHDAVREKLKETRDKRANEAWREFWC